MTERICNQQEFLKSLVLLKPSKGKRRLLSANEEEFKALVEVIINLKLLIDNRNKQKVYSKTKLLVIYFNQKNVLRKKIVLKYLNKHYSTLKFALATFLNELLKLAVICAYAA